MGENGHLKQEVMRILSGKLFPSHQLQTGSRPLSLSPPTIPLAFTLSRQYPRIKPPLKTIRNHPISTPVPSARLPLAHMSILHPTTDEERTQVTALLLYGAPLFAVLSTFGIILGTGYLGSQGWQIPDLDNTIVHFNAGVAMIGAGAGGFCSESVPHKRIGFAMIFAFFGLYQYGLWFIAAAMAVFLYQLFIAGITS